ncbi:SRPBCC family protein [Winogradskyella alexanderae]|uniref:SRPBCC family protein n=1 Tax=Winogradskyella alexanderae TaxID=2877123 RepID=A0ABS7XSC9_9FLAO|nr:SRPBCC family protein [Winogradskyella alexanderae]MCA0131946.1 SRPBCC family protein [Winogradskyella alexanderae]
MTIALYVVLAIIGIIVLLALIAPKSYNVSRSIQINKPLEEVFNYIKYIKKHNDWSPWKKKDPNMTQEFEGNDGEVGFISRWKGNKDVGTGEQEITRIIENECMESQLRFFKPWKSQSNAFITVDVVDSDTTKVTWGFSGVNKPPSNIFFLFFNMDKTVGADFEDGLNDLKTILES